jgi:hypothetical protein
MIPPTGVSKETMSEDTSKFQMNPNRVEMQ